MADAKSSDVKSRDKTKPGFDKEGKAYPGVDEETGVRVAVTFDGLKDEFGEKTGAEMYRKIAGIRGGSIFFNPQTEATDFHPPLRIDGLKSELRAEVDAVLNVKE